MILEDTGDNGIAAVCFLDVETRQTITSKLNVMGPGRATRNASGLFVVMDKGKGQSPLEYRVDDPERRYLARSFGIKVPPDILHEPLEVLMYPAPVARSRCGSTVIRCSVIKKIADEPVPQKGVLLIVSVDLGKGDIVSGRGVSDARGEAIIFVPGVPLLRISEKPGGTPTEKTFIATIRAIPEPPWSELDSIAVPPITPIATIQEFRSGGEHYVRVELSQ